MPENDPRAPRPEDPDRPQAPEAPAPAAAGPEGGLAATDPRQPEEWEGYSAALLNDLLDG
jgi:hypothetical protein